jgi:hypothetical protein
VRNQFVDVRFTRDLDVAIALLDVAVERIQNAFIAEIDVVVGADDANEGLYSVGIDAPNCQIIDLATDEHAMALEDTLVQAPLVGRRRETMTGDDRVHKFLPVRTGFRMT